MTAFISIPKINKGGLFFMKRLPKGFGSVYKLSGNRRRPYAVRVRSGSDKNGKPTYSILGYFATSEEALTVLTEYNKNPYDLKNDSVTIADMWEIFKKRRFSEISASGCGIYTAAYKHLKELWDIPIKNIKTYQMQRLIDNIDKSWQTKSHIQTLLHQMFDIAIELDVIDKNYASFVKIGNRPKSDMHKPFTDAEIQKLFSVVFSEDIADTVLIMIYTGMRPSELLGMKTENIHLAEKYMVGGVKTKAGKGRVIPISDKVMPLVRKRYSIENRFFVDIPYHTYSKYFKSLMNKLGMEHLPHDCRHTFASMANTAGVNPTSVKLIMGHASQDLTERVYTHKAVEELISAVNMI